MSQTLLDRLRPAPDSMIACTLRRGRPLWTQLIPLGWSVWAFIVPFFEGAGYTLRWFLLTLVSFPLFLALFVAVLRAPAAHVQRWGVAMCALGIALLPWYLAGVTYFMFGCVYISWGTSAPGRARTVALVLLKLVAANAVLLAVGMWAGRPWQAFAWLPPTALVTCLLVQMQRMAEQRDEALLLSQEEVRRLAAMAERERIGRDLHDLLGHTLSLVALKADLAGKLVQRDLDAARAQIAELGQVAREALAQVRRAVTGIRATGLAGELAAARVLLESGGVALEGELEPATLPPEQETALALCLREAATNVQRHARARRVQVRFARAGHAWRLEVEDDGRGGQVQPGNGLRGMRERLEAVGGRLHVGPAGSGRGLRLVAEVPLHHPALL